MCQVRKRIEVTQCYKCLGFGQTRAKCNGPERKDMCWKSGKRDTRRKHVTTTQNVLLVRTRVWNVSTYMEKRDVSTSRRNEGNSKHEMDKLKAIQVNLRGGKTALD